MNARAFAKIGTSTIAFVFLFVLGTAKHTQAVNLVIGSSGQPISYANPSWKPQVSSELTNTRTDGDRDPEQLVCIGWDILNISSNPFQGSCVITANALSFSELSLFGESSLDYLSGISPKVVWSSPSQAAQKPSMAGGKGYVQVNWESNRTYKTLMEGKEPPSIIGIALLIASIYGLRQVLKNLVGDE